MIASPPPPPESEVRVAETSDFFNSPPESPTLSSNVPQSSAQAAIDSFLRAAEALSEIHTLRDSRLERDLVELARAIASRVISRELATDPAILIALARDGMGALAERESAVVRFSTDVPEEIRNALTTQLQARSQSCSVIFDPELQPGSCVVESSQGYVDESVSARLDVVMEQLGFGRGGLQ